MVVVDAGQSTPPYLWVGAASGEICVYPVEVSDPEMTGASVQAAKVWAAHNGGVTCLMGLEERQKGGGLVWSAGADWTIKLWAEGGVQPLATLAEHTLPVSCLMLCGSQLYSGSNDKTIRVWDAFGVSTMSAGAMVGHSGGVLSLCCECPSRLDLPRCGDFTWVQAV